MLLVALLLILPPTASAIDLAGNNLIIPVAGRTPGAGTFWETDLVITNLSPEYNILKVTVETWIGNDRLAFDVDVPALGTVTIEDFMRTRFGRDTGIGLVRISNALPDAQLAARARVHTIGDVGQSVPALPMAALARDSFIPGLTGTAGNRSNLGIANPNDTAADVTLVLRNANGQNVASVARQVAAHTVLQQEIGAAFHPQLANGDVTVHVASSVPVYTFGSVVRTSTGDPSFVIGTATRGTPDLVVTPQCSDPAPLVFADPAKGPVRPGWIIAYKAGTNTQTVTPALAAKYGFTPTFTIGIFVAANLTPEMIAGLRCEAPVRSISQGSHVSLFD